MRILETEIPIYRQKLTLIECSSVDEIKNYLNDIRFPDPDCIDDIFAHTIWWKRTKGDLEYTCIYVVLNTDNAFKALTPGVVAHESLHVVEHTFDYRDILFDNSAGNQEYANYLLEWVVDKIYCFLNNETSK